MSMEFFVTGTDTGCGKTLATLTLMEALAAGGRRVAGMKPVAAGAESTPEGLRNQDALAIQARCRPPQPYERVNPCCLATPAAPHLAARAEGRIIDLTAIRHACDELRAEADHLVVEGVGGWRVPLTEDHEVADLCRLLELPVILVVGLELGCLNHALLSTAAILESGIPLVGWIATSLTPEMPFEQENLAALTERIPVPLFGHLPWHARPDPAALARHLKL